MKLKTGNRKNNETNTWFFFENISNVGKPLARLRKKLEETQITNIRNERGNITTTPTDVSESKNTLTNFTPTDHPG